MSFDFPKPLRLAVVARIPMVIAVAAMVVTGCPGQVAAGDAIWVADGDTIHLGEDRIRLWGIDAPELDTPEGEVAREYLRLLLDPLEVEMLRCQLLYEDRYGRSVARCVMPDDTDLACEMVRAGHARDWPRYSDGYYTRCEPD